MISNGSNGNCEFSVVVSHFVAVVRYFDLPWIARWNTDLDVDAGFAASILVAGIGNLNERRNGTRSDVTRPAVLDVLIDHSRGWSKGVPIFNRT